jgi:hypothetical protein
MGHSGLVQNGIRQHHYSNQVSFLKLVKNWGVERQKSREVLGTYILAFISKIDLIFMSVYLELPSPFDPPTGTQRPYGHLKEHFSRKIHPPRSQEQFSFWKSVEDFGGAGWIQNQADQGYNVSRPSFGS